MGKGDLQIYCETSSSSEVRLESCIAGKAHSDMPAAELYASSQHCDNMSNSSIRSRHQSNSGINGVPPTINIMPPIPSLLPCNGSTKHREYKQSNGSITSSVRKLLQRGSTCGKGTDVDSEEAEKLSSDGKKNHESGRGLISRCRGNIVLAILLLANLINYMDRYTIAGVLDDVRTFYGLTYSQAGLLQTSFIVSYMLLSPLFGYLGDRYNRKYIMACGIFFWSLITLAGSFIPQQHFLVFLALRALVGVGEASYSTIAPTIIADMFVKSMRTKALSIFYFAIPVGSGLGYIVGSKVAVLMGGWQWALRVTPVLGVLCTVLVLVAVADPPRGAAEGISHTSRSSWTADVVYLFKHKSFMLSSLGFTCVAFVAGALALWAPLYIHKSMEVQRADISMDTVSLTFGIITCLAGFAGVGLGSLSAAWLRKYTPRADPLVCAFGMIASAPFFYIAICMPLHSYITTWVMIFIGETLLSLNWAIVTDILLYIVVPTRRSMAEAVQILLSHALGDAGSPYLVGLIADKLAEANGDRVEDSMVRFISLQYSLYLPCFVCVLGGAFFLATALFLQRDREKTDLAIKAAAIHQLYPKHTADDSAPSGDSSGSSSSCSDSSSGSSCKGLFSAAKGVQLGSVPGYAVLQSPSRESSAATLTTLLESTKL